MSAAAEEVVEIRPHAGPQWEALQSPADICISGGARGGGKTFSLLVEPARHMDNPEFRAVIFRRTSKQIRSPGGLWDESKKLYPLLGATAREGNLDWLFPSGMTVTFAHLEFEQDRESWLGAQIPLIEFDQLETFTYGQFFFLIGSNRSTCGVRPYIRATCNPDPDSWLAEFLDWWIDADGFAIPERAGRLRWFFRVGDKIEWHHGPTPEATSVTFVPSTVFDNPTLLRIDPGYVTRLKSLPLVERERHLRGNWKIRAAAGNVFREEWFEVVDDYTRGGRSLRYWDLASTEPDARARKRDAGPDFTAGARWSKGTTKSYLVDVKTIRGNPAEVERLVTWAAHDDGKAVEVWIEQEPGASGKALVSHYQRNVLPGFNVRGHVPSGDKVTFAMILSAACEAGNVALVRGPWNRGFVNNAVGFPELAHDDEIDAASKGYERLVGGVEWGAV